MKDQEKESYIEAYSLLLFAIVVSIVLGVAIYYGAPLLRVVLFGELK